MAKNLIDFTEIPPDGDLWEMFARDLLQGLGFFIEAQPNRGPDGGKDLLVTEQLGGLLNNYRWRWLVSCKHFAKSNRAVSEADELNIRERLESFAADGFIGFYSTVPSSGLYGRLESLKAKKRIKDFRVFDSKLIENYLIRIGFSGILMRYFPEGYKRVKPAHLITSEFIPLHCHSCQKELIEPISTEQRKSVIASVYKTDDTGVKQVQEVY